MHTQTSDIPTAHQFLSGGGMMGALIRDTDWSLTPLGDISTWPQSLRTCVHIVLTSRQPMFVWWGEELINIYNDAYLSILGGKHPQALGQPASVVWSEIWNEAGPRAETAMHDNVGTYDEALLLITERNGYPEETYCTFSYSPVPGDDGGVGGIICASTDDTERIVGERQLRTLKDLGNELAQAGSDTEIYERAIRVLKTNPRDFPFAAIYEISTAGDTAHFKAATAEDLPQAMTTANIALDDHSGVMSQLFMPAVLSGNTYMLDDADILGVLPSGEWKQPPARLLVIPVSRAGQKQPLAMLVVGMNPYRQPNEKYLDFFNLVSDQVAAAMANVRAYEEERKRAEALMEINRVKTSALYDANEKLKDTEERMRLAAEGTGLATWDLDLRTRKIIYTPRLSGIFGYDSVEDMTHEAMRAHILAEDRQTIVEKAFREAMRSGVYEYEARIVRRDGMIRWVRTQGRGINDKDGTPLRMLGTMIDITDAKTASRRLEDSELRYRQLIQHLPVALYTCSADGRIEMYNEAAVKLWGRTPDVDKDMWGGAWKMYRADGAPMPTDEFPMAVALRTGRSAGSSEVIMERPDGSRTHVLLYPEILRDAAGKLTGAVNMIFDLTERKIAAAHVARLAAIVQSSDDAIISKTLDGVITSWNDAAERILGYTESEMIGQPILKLIPPERHHEETHILSQLKNGHRIDHFETQRLTKSGRMIDVAITVSPVKDEKGNLVGASKILRDITDSKLAEKALRESEERFREANEELERRVTERTFELSAKNEELVRQKDFVENILDASVDVISVLDKDLTYIALNRKATEMYGEGIVGKNMLDVFPHVRETGMYDDVLSALAGEIVHRPDYQSPVLQRSFENFYIPLKDPNGEVREIMLIGHDITDYMNASQELKMMNEALVKSNAELEQFAYVSSHDLQEPLRKIQTFSDLLSRSLDKEGADAKNYIEKINASAGRMTTLIKDLLSYSRLSKTNDQFADVDLQQILDNIKNDFEVVIRQKDAQVRSVPLPVIKAIPIQLNQLFYNLIGNALKFSENAPVIDITCSSVTRQQMKDLPRLNPQLSYIMLGFKDNGIGFEQVYAEKIFTIFQRLNDRQQYSGTGIGLAICKKIAENHGGYIEAHSRPGEGAAFTVYLAV